MNAVSRRDIDNLVNIAVSLSGTRSRDDLMHHRYADCVDLRSMIFLVLVSWGMSLPGIARFFGLKHPSVWYALRTIKCRLTLEMKTAEKYRKFLSSIPDEMIVRHTWPYMDDLFGSG